MARKLKALCPGVVSEEELLKKRHDFILLQKAHAWDVYRRVSDAEQEVLAKMAGFRKASVVYLADYRASQP